MLGKVVHFEIPVDDSDRGIDFYRTAFGWAFRQFEPAEYWTTEAGDGDGIGGALTKRNEDVPAPTFYIAVEDVDATLTAIESAGGKSLTEKMPIPGVGWFAFFADTEGNRIGLYQDDPTVPLPEGTPAR